ncbi:MAG TPA: N-acetyltransferase [Rhodanobacter sp.]|nr:N-acetyltransferase [Rhodanobacter sp.]
MRIATATTETPVSSLHAPLQVRRAQPTDLDALVALEQSSFSSDRMSRAQYRRHLDSASALVLIAIAEHRIVGSSMLFFRKHSRSARLYSLATLPQARGRGVGSSLLGAVEVAARARHCDVLRLEVRADNAHAIALYARMGYRRTRHLARYYEDGADGWQYVKRLD